MRPEFQEVWSGEEEAPVDQEVLLLGARERHDRVGIVVAEEVEDPLGLPCPRLLRPQQRRLVVEGLARHRHEDGRDAERVAVRVL